MTGTIDLDSIDRALAGAAPHLDQTGQRVAVATYRTLARGRPASPADIATAAGVASSTVDRLLGDWGAVFRGDAGDVVGFWGLAVVKMPHRLRIDDHDLYAWCAWDPMFLARIVGPLDVSTDDPVAGATITYHLDGEGTLHDLSHPASELSFLRPDREWDDDVMATFCHYVLQFTGPDTAAQWTAEHPGTFALELDAAVELARRHTDRTFGPALS